MIEAIAALSAAPLAPLPSLSKPSALVMERFNAIMNAAPLSQSPVGPLQSTLQMTFTSPLEGPQTLGMQILGKLKSFSTEYGQKWQDVARSLDSLALSPHVSISEALRLQGELMQIGVHTELAGKGIARTTQNVDTLVRMS